MAGAVFASYTITTRPHPRAPLPASYRADAVAGPSRLSRPQQYELHPIMTPAVWHNSGSSSSNRPPAVVLPGGAVGGEYDDGDDYDGDQAETPPLGQPRQTSRPRVAPISNDMVLEQALPRASRRHGLSHALARSVSLSIAMGGLVTGLYLVIRWQQKRGVAGVAIGANGVAIIIDAFMLVDLINTVMPRVSPYAIAGLDIVMMAAALTAGTFVGLSDRGYEHDPAPWKHVMLVTAGLTWATAGVRLIYIIWSFLDCQLARKTRLEMQRNLV